MNKKKKYKIDEEMSKLNLVAYKIAIRYIPEMLDIAFNTFHNYRKMDIDAKADIPYVMVRKMEIFFGLKEGGLANYKVASKSLKEVMKIDAENQHRDEDLPRD